MNISLLQADYCPKYKMKPGLCYQMTGNIFDSSFCFEILLYGMLIDELLKHVFAAVYS